MTTTLNRADPAGAVPRKKDRGGPWLSLLAWVIGILFVLPVAWMVLTSFHSES
ncbi:sugar ABC transporter permease, partial [Actinoplanes sp. ATCC 53533]